MSGAACKVVINSGGRAIGVVDVFKERNPQISIAELRAALNEAVTSVMYTSLYLEIDEGEFPQSYTDDIQKPINSIITNLPNKIGREAKELIDSCCYDLRKALDKLEELFN